TVITVKYWTPICFDINIKLPAPPPSSPQDIQIIAHMPSGILFADKLGVPFIAGVHNSDLEVLTNPLYKFHFKKRLEKALHNAKAIACRSFVIKDKLLKLYPEFENKTFTAPSGVKKEIIKTDFHPLNKEKIKVLTCANFKKRKNIDKVIEACKGLENFELTVIGDGKGRKSLEEIDKSVKFTGHLPHNEVLAKMHDSDIFILPSIGETFGMVYLEAMSQGCITICTKDDGISGIIKNGENGFLTLPISNEIRKILLNIKNMDDDKLNTLRYNSFHTIKEYTSDRCADEYLQQMFKIL
uniref:glycosyltransferase family 4 protein n=1 Tax=Candidatus Stercorousia sp. TaxID=3048886 RepID=UPI004028CB0F